MDEEPKWVTYAEALTFERSKGLGYLAASDHLVQQAAEGLITAKARLIVDGEGEAAERSENAAVKVEFWQAFAKPTDRWKCEPRTGYFSAFVGASPAREPKRALDTLSKTSAIRLVQLFDVQLSGVGGKASALQAAKDRPSSAPRAAAEMPRAAPPMSGKQAREEMAALRAQGERKEGSVQRMLGKYGGTRDFWRKAYGDAQMGRPPVSFSGNLL